MTSPSRVCTGRPETSERRVRDRSLRTPAAEWRIGPCRHSRRRLNAKSRASTRRPIVGSVRPDDRAADPSTSRRRSPHQHPSRGGISIMNKRMFLKLSGGILGGSFAKSVPRRNPDVPHGPGGGARNPQRKSFTIIDLPRLSPSWQDGWPGLWIGLVTPSRSRTKRIL